jgi:hypothetical protein
MLMQNMLVKNGDGNGDIDDGVHLRPVTMDGTNGVLLVAMMRGTMIANLFSLYHESGTHVGVLKIKEIG